MCAYYVLGMITGAEDIDRKKKNNLYLHGIPILVLEKMSKQTNKVTKDRDR